MAEEADEGSLRTSYLQVVHRALSAVGVYGLARGVRGCVDSTIRWCWIPNWLPSWCPTSQNALQAAETRMLRCVRSSFSRRFVSLSDGSQLWTLTLGGGGSRGRTPLVLLHGFGGGMGLWVQNLDALSRRRPVYALDLLGFGQSSRPLFSKDPRRAEDQFVEALEQWRAKVGLESMILLGHNLGGFLAASYAIRHPGRVKHLILVEPWGFLEPPDSLEADRPVPVWIKALGAVFRPFNPLAGLRLLGPLGPSLVQTFRPDLRRKFTSMFTDQTVSEYVYHLNVQTPSGEAAFKVMSGEAGWARRPMLQRIHQLPPSVSLTVLSGCRSAGAAAAGRLKEVRPWALVDIVTVRGAGHYVFADQPEDFNQRVSQACDQVD